MTPQLQLSKAHELTDHRCALGDWRVCSHAGRRHLHSCCGWWVWSDENAVPTAGLAPRVMTLALATSANLDVPAAGTPHLSGGVHAAALIRPYWHTRIRA